MWFPVCILFQVYRLRCSDMVQTKTPLLLLVFLLWSRFKSSLEYHLYTPEFSPQELLWWFLFLLVASGLYLEVFLSWLVWTLYHCNFSTSLHALSSISIGSFLNIVTYQYVAKNFHFWYGLYLCVNNIIILFLVN